MKNKKKAFTLTELLVVVIVIGVLSAAVLPKFSKVVETRKTTEAEALMAGIRTEQEKRCMLDKPYLTDLSQLSDIIKTASTKNYQISLQGKGVEAASKGKYSYTLQMPSYADGRICCAGRDCEKLNKNYPACAGFVYEESPESCVGSVAPVEPEVKECSGPSVQACGCQNKGTKTRECNTTTGEWSAWGACSISDSCECTGTKPAEDQGCNGCGTQTRTVTCDTSTGVWKTGSWGACSKTEAQCTECPEGKEYDAASGTCVCDRNSLEYLDCEEERECLDGSFAMPIWHEDSCTCEDTCPQPSETPHSLVCTRVSYQTAMAGSLVPEGQEALTVSEARQACEMFGRDVSVYEAVMPSADCSDPRKPCTQTPGWGKHWTCQEGEVTCGTGGIGGCDPCTCICGVG